MERVRIERSLRRAGGLRGGDGRQLRRRPPRAPGARGRRRWRGRGRSGGAGGRSHVRSSPGARARPRARARPPSRRSAQKEELLAGLGVDRLAVLPFDAAVAALSAEAFAGEVLAGALGARHVRGRRVLPLRARGGKGTRGRLEALGERLGFSVRALPPVLATGGPDQQQPRAGRARPGERPRGPRAPRPALLRRRLAWCAGTGAGARSASPPPTSTPRTRCFRRGVSTPGGAASPGAPAVWPW